MKNTCQVCGKKFISDYWGRTNVQKYCPGIDGKKSKCMTKAHAKRTKENREVTVAILLKTKEKKKARERVLQNILCSSWR